MSVSTKPIYQAYNAPQPTSAAIVKVATGTSIKTMLQVAPSAASGIYVIAWGYNFDTAVGGVGTIELLQTDVAATVTAHAASGVARLTRGAPASTVTLSAAGTGYTASAEGTIAATTVYDAQSLAATTPLQPYEKVFTPEQRPFIPASGFLRVRATIATTGTNLLCWVKWHEAV